MKKIMLILAVLIIILILLTRLNLSRQTQQEGILSVSGPAGQIHTVMQFPSEADTLLQTAKGNFQAAMLSHFLPAHAIASDWQQMTFHSSDGAQVTIEREELSRLFLAKIESAEGDYLRLIIPEDSFSQRWLKNIKQLELK